MKKISVIVPTKNAGSRFDEVLKKIRAQQGGKDIEIIAVDSGSTDSTVETAKKYGCKVFSIKSTEFSHGNTRNVAISKTTGKIIVLMTQDAVPADGKWLSELLKPFEDPLVAGVFSRQIPFKETNIAERFFISRQYSSIPRTNYPSKKPKAIDVFFSNVSSAIKKSVWKKNKFSSDIPSSEDQLWAKKTIQAGFKTVYAPSSKVFHSHNYDLAGVFKRYFDSGAALSTIYGGVSDSFIRLFKKFLKDFWLEIKYAASKKPVMLPYVLAYNFVKLSALFLGKNNEVIPRFAKKRMSTVPQFWK